MNWWDLIPGVSGVINKVLSLIPDPNERARTEAALQAAEQSAEMQQALVIIQGQIDIDKIEAASGSLFQAGARPGILWICAAGLGWQYILSPLISTVQALYHGTPPPVVDMSGLFPLLFGMLGLGAMRSFERVNGVAAGQGPASRATAVAVAAKK